MHQVVRLMLADALKEIRQDAKYVFNRADVRQNGPKTKLVSMLFGW